MEIQRWRFYFVLAVVLMPIHEYSSVSASYFAPYNVSYDHRAIIIGGNRRMLISAGIHYPRATPQMWPGLIAKSKEGGADLIQTYVFWNGHEPVRGQYNFEERYDLVKFAKLIASNGLYLHLRIGPYVCAEWNFGGFPVWLRDVPGIEFRTNNAAYKAEMEKFVKKIVDLMKQEMLFSWQGGPIILLQIENEYGNIEGLFGQDGKEYIKWAANMALGLGANVPWVMCKQTDAPENIIDACNGFYCDGYKPNSYKKPSIWTEDWNGWFANWGERVPHRPVEDNAFAVARFFQRGGSYHNYYMYFGGTNFERTAGGPLQSTSYDYDAPIDEYGLLSQPKWGHLKDLHSAIKLCEPALVAVDDAPQYVKLGPMQEAHIYSTSYIQTNSKLPKNVNICSAFLANIDEHTSVDVNIFGEVYTLPPWSVSILPDCKQVAFNTAKVGAQVSLKSWESDSSSTSSKAKFLSKLNNEIHISENWTYFKEPVGAWGDSAFTSKGILEHLNVTKDATDYLWYITRIDVTAEDISFWEEKGALPSLIIDSMRDVVRVFANGHLAGSTHGKWVKVSLPIRLVQGSNELALVSETVGLQNYGAFLEKDGAGFRGQVKLIGMKAGEIDLSASLWTYQVGLEGEYKKLYAIEEHENAEWTDLKLDTLSTTFTWYKNYFDAPEGNDTVSLDLGSMSKGQAWVNGHGIGRFWSLVAPKDGCPETCDYRGEYNENKCATNCGKPTQTRYHIPREWLQPSNNLLVLFDEEGGNPTQISVKTHFTKIICGQVSETHYPPLSAWSLAKSANGNILVDNSAPEVHLRCDDRQKISSVTFASYGNPSGSCQEFSVGKCHAQHSLSVVSEACQGRNSCTISVSNKRFGQDPCHGIVKTLAVQAECISDTDINYTISSM